MGIWVYTTASSEVGLGYKLPQHFYSLQEKNKIVWNIKNRLFEIYDFIENLGTDFNYNKISFLNKKVFENNIKHILFLYDTIISYYIELLFITYDISHNAKITVELSGIKFSREVLEEFDKINKVVNKVIFVFTISINGNYISPLKSKYLDFTQIVEKFIKTFYNSAKQHLDFELKNNVEFNIKNPEFGVDNKPLKFHISFSLMFYDYDFNINNVKKYLFIKSKENNFIYKITKKDYIKIINTLISKRVKIDFITEKDYKKIDNKLFLNYNINLTEKELTDIMGNVMGLSFYFSNISRSLLSIEIKDNTSEWKTLSKKINEDNIDIFNFYKIIYNNIKDTIKLKDYLKYINNKNKNTIIEEFIRNFKDDLHRIKIHFDTIDMLI